MQYRVHGIDRESGLESSLVIDAQSHKHATTLAQSEGINVTAVECVNVNRVLVPRGSRHLVVAVLVCAVLAGLYIITLMFDHIDQQRDAVTTDSVLQEVLKGSEAVREGTFEPPNESALRAEYSAVIQSLHDSGLIDRMVLSETELQVWVRQPFSVLDFDQKQAVCRLLYLHQFGEDHSALNRVRIIEHQSETTICEFNTRSGLQMK